MGRHHEGDGDESDHGDAALDAGFRDLGFARLDTGRLDRTGDPEVIFGQGKTTEQVLLLVLELLLEGTDRPAIVTRASREMLHALAEEYDEVAIDELARCAAVGRLPEPRGRVGVLSAGTSDRVVAAEAAFIARAIGAEVEQISDVGVAGIHRLLAVRPTIEQMDCLVVVAGMDGALPSAVGGLTGVPLIAVPTSVGYGASFGGVAALLTMLNSCAPGVLVCNIDNGFGAGLAAARIARRSVPPPPAKRKRRRRVRKRRPGSPTHDRTSPEPPDGPSAAASLPAGVLPLVSVTVPGLPAPAPRPPMSEPAPARRDPLPSPRSPQALHAPVVARRMAPEPARVEATRPVDAPRPADLTHPARVEATRPADASRPAALTHPALLEPDQDRPVPEPWHAQVAPARPNPPAEAADGFASTPAEPDIYRHFPLGAPLPPRPRRVTGPADYPTAPTRDDHSAEHLPPPESPSPTVGPRDGTDGAQAPGLPW